MSSAVVNVSSPGPSTTEDQPFGAVTIQASCAPVPVMGHMAFTLACGAVLTNRGSSPVTGQAQQVDGQGNAVGTASSFTLNRGQSVQLTAPTSGNQWLVVDLSQSQVEWIGVATVAGVVGTLGLAGYGAVTLIQRMVHRHRHHHAS